MNRDKLILPTEYNLSNFTLDDKESPSVDFWIEQHDNLSPRINEFSSKFGNTTLVGWIQSGRAQYYSAINRILGYANTEGTSLRRVNPQAHPKFPQLYANRIEDSRGVKYAGRLQGDPPAVQKGSGLKEYCHYGREQITIQFGPPRFKIREDEEVTGTGKGEWMRNVDFTVQPNIYDVSMQTGQFKFAEGDAGNPNSKSFPGELNFLEVKTSFVLGWRLVPEDFILDTVSYTEFGYPTKIVNAAGKVNSVAFCGYPAGTLLLLEPEIDRYLSGTLRTRDGRTPVYMCDVTLPLIHFNPPSHSVTYKGHNLKPWWKTGDTTLKYYLVTNDGTTTGIRIYGEYDFAKIFEHWSV